MLGEYQREEALIHFQRGMILERANRVEEAVEEYRRALAHNPHLAEAHDALGSYYQRQGMLAKAADAFRTVALLADDYPAHYHFGGVLADLGRYDEALAGFRRCLDLVPDDPAARYAIAIIQFQRGAYEDALQHLRRALPALGEEWEIHHLIGACQLRLGDYDAAQAAFERALALTARSDAREQVGERLAALARYRAADPPCGLKDRLYAERGVALLGSAQDDGLNVAECQDYYFTYPDIAATIRRLAAQAAHGGWRVSCVVAADRLSHPLAAAVAGELDIPLLRPDEARPGEMALAVLAVGRAPELLELVTRRIPGPAISFCLGLNWLRQSDVLPDVTGVIVRGGCGVPWEAELRRLRALGAPADQVEQCLARAASAIRAALAEAPHEPNLAEQVEYYRIRSGLRFVAPRS
jgi:Tfp pilus assembly protein PilF